MLSKSKLDLHVGETATLTATVHPTSLGMAVTWSSLDEEIATVDNGVVTAMAQGVTYVVATSEDGTQKGACMVSVNPERSARKNINWNLWLPRSDNAAHCIHIRRAGARANNDTWG